jgi:hypothetical protein
LDSAGIREAIAPNPFREYYLNHHKFLDDHYPHDEPAADFGI